MKLHTFPIHYYPLGIVVATILIIEHEDGTQGWLNRWHP